MGREDIERLCIEKYQDLRNLKLVGQALSIPWQTVYVHLKRAGVSVVGDKARYGSVSDRLAVLAEQSFKKSVPMAVDNNDLKFQATVDFYVGDCTIDVKASVLQESGRTISGKSFSSRWAYCISKQKDVADFFVLYAYIDENEKRNLKHVFLIPREMAINSSSISIPLTLKSKWADYEISESELLPFFSEYENNLRYNAPIHNEMHA
jgi:hypothetical protein